MKPVYSCATEDSAIAFVCSEVRQYSGTNGICSEPSSACELLLDASVMLEASSAC